MYLNLNQQTKREFHINRFSVNCARKCQILKLKSLIRIAKMNVKKGSFNLTALKS